MQPFASTTLSSGERGDLYLGDANSLLREIEPASIDLVVTSPPYCIGKEYDKYISADDFKNEISTVSASLLEVIKPGGSICWQIGYHVKNNEIVPLDIPIYEIMSRFPTFIQYPVRILAPTKDKVLEQAKIWSLLERLFNLRSFASSAEELLQIALVELLQTKPWADRHEILCDLVAWRWPTDIASVPMRASDLEVLLFATDQDLIEFNASWIRFTNSIDIMLRSLSRKQCREP